MVASFSRYHCFASILVAMSVLALGGCNREPAQYTITGEVTYQNQSVADGEIIFSDVKGNAPAAVGRIENGRYQLRTVAGEKQIRITATKKTGKMINGTMGMKYEERVDIIPTKYNTATTLVRSVPPNDNSTLDFRLP